MTKLIYLDQNKWSELFKQDKGVKTEEKVAQALQKIRKASENEDAIFPISVVNLIETARYEEKELFDFMYELSNSFYIAPFNVAEEEEFRKFLVEKNDRAYPSLTTRIIGVGLPFAFGGHHYGFTGSGEISDKLIKEMEKLLSSKEVYNFLKRPEIVKKMRDRSLEEYRSEETEKEIEKNEKKYNSNRKRRREKIAREFFYNVAYPITLRAMNEQIDIRNVTANLGSYLNEGENSKAHEFMLNFPSNYARANLIASRNIQHTSGEKIDPNDLNDIMSLSVAMAHCDIVLTENFWTDAATSDTNLGTNLDTKVAHNFEPIIEEL